MLHWKTTRYFKEKVLVKRPHIRVDLCERVVKQAERDGRRRYWAWVPEDGHYWRVVTEPDGTLHNAMRDRTYRRRGKP